MNLTSVELIYLITSCVILGAFLASKAEKITEFIKPLSADDFIQQAEMGCRLSLFISKDKKEIKRLQKVLGLMEQWQKKKIGAREFIPIPYDSLAELVCVWQTGDPVQKRSLCAMMADNW